MKITELNLKVLSTQGREEFLKNIINELIQLSNEEDDSYKETIFMELLGDVAVDFISCVNNVYTFSTKLSSEINIYCESLKYPETHNYINKSIKLNQLYPYYLNVKMYNIIFSYLINVD